MLAALQSLYADAQYAIHVGGRRGVALRSGCGVKQGCPLSPTLFGLLLDGLHAALLADAPGAGPRLQCGRLVPDLGYADDFCLLAASASDLQRLLDAAHAFLSAVGMEVSAEKTCVLVFGPPRAARGLRWTCGGAPLQLVTEYKYLGVLFTAAKGVGGAFGRQRRQLFAAWTVLRRKFGNLHYGTSFALQLELFEQSVPTAAS